MESLLFVKLFVSVILVLTLSAVAEHISPRAAGLLAGFIILAIIATAQLVGSRWAGLLSAFPSTLFPLILIVHLSYDKTHVHTIIKNVPTGQLHISSAAFVRVMAPSFKNYIQMLTFHSGFDGIKRGHLFGKQYMAFETADTDNQFIKQLV